MSRVFSRASVRSWTTPPTAIATARCRSHKACNSWNTTQGHLPKAAPYPAQQPLTEWLRETTRERHRELDSSPMLRDLLRPGLSVGRYYHWCWLCGARTGRTLPWISVPADCPAELSPYVSRCYALESDLQTLHGLVKTTNTSVPTPVFEKKEIKQNDDVITGPALCEGSSLGSH